jgi:hypothetical protein
MVCALSMTGFLLPVLSFSPSSYATATVSTCSYGQLEVAIPTGPGAGPGGAAGNDPVAFVIANTGNEACTIKGFPTLTFYYTANDKAVKIRVQHRRSEVYAEPKPELVTIEPGGVATFGLTYTDGWAVAHDTAACKVNTVEFTLPTINPDGGSYGARLSFDACQSHHEVSLTPIESGLTPRHVDG